MRFLSPFTQLVEGITIALEALRANKARAGLTIMGVALGVFVVVAMSSVVRGINESFRRDLEAAGPTSFYVYRRPVGGFNSCESTADDVNFFHCFMITLLFRLPNSVWLDFQIFRANFR